MKELNFKPDSPEAKAALAVYEAAPDPAPVMDDIDREERDRKREAAAEVDAVLTKDMTSEERGDYYAERAEDAAKDGDSYRYDQYQRRVEEAAEEMGYLDGVDQAEDEAPETEGVETEDDPVRKAFDEYEVTPEAEAVLDENYPDRKPAEEPKQKEEPAEETVIDENTLVGEYDGSPDFVDRGTRIVREQEKLRERLQADIDTLANELAVLRMSGAER